MAKRSMAYDHAAYISPYIAPIGEAGGGATTNYGKFVAFTAMICKAAQLTASVLGTLSAHAFDIVKVTGITTSTLATVQMGTNTVGYTTNVTLGNTALAAGDQLMAKSAADTAGKAVIAVELLLNPGADLTL